MAAPFKVLLVAAAFVSTATADSLFALRPAVDAPRAKNNRQRAQQRRAVAQAPKRLKHWQIPLAHGEEPEMNGPIIMLLSQEDKKLLQEVKFTDKAIWARPLPGQWYMELSRALVDIITLGFFEFSRLTAGNAYHWAFIARGKLREGWLAGWRNESYVYLVAQDNWLCPKNWRELGKAGKKANKMRRFTVHVAYSLQEAADVMGCGKRKGFVKFPKRAYGKNPRKDLEVAWRPCKQPRSLEEMIEILQTNPSTKKKYKIDRNNCQHFASYLFHDVGDAGRRVKIKRKIGNPACV